MKKALRTFFYDLRYSVGTQISFAFGVLLILFTFCAVYNHYALHSMQQNYYNTMNTYYDIIDLKEGATLCDRTITEYLRSGDRTSLSNFNDTARAFRAKLQQLIHERSPSLEALYLMRSISDAFDTYHATCCTACFKFYGNDYEYYTSMYSAQRINTYLQQYCDELLQVALADGEKAYAQLIRTQNTMTAINTGSVVCALLLFSLSLIYVNTNITEPLNRLMLAARKIAQGDFNISLVVKNNHGTIDVLNNAFQSMTQNIQEMMHSIQEKAETEKTLLREQQKNVEYQQMLSEANFLALQMQTNPHFLFNTLNSISRTITLGMSDEAVRMIESMVELLRYNLANTEQAVPLGEELRIAREYLSIQHHRFGDRIRAIVDCPADLQADVMLPRFTLQPIVENAILHGLEPKENGGCIKIKVRRRNGRCIIRVIDNGLGISRQRLALLQQTQYNVGTKRTSIGLHNTRKRLEIFSGQPDALRLRSRENLGTTLVITLPMKGEHSDV